MGKSIFLIILFFIFITPICLGETIKLKSGKIISAPIEEQTDEYIRVDISGIPITYYFDEIESIDGRRIYTPKTYSTPQTRISSLTPKDIFAQISPAVVYITTKTPSGQEYLGSGFIVDSQGVIVTNYHVIQGAQEAYVKLKDGAEYPVKGIIYYDIDRDLCILKINADYLPTISLGDSNKIQIGETVYCIGNPLGLEYSFSDGMLSGVRDHQNLKWLQFTAPISPGNSGGPLINPQGQVIGMVTFLMTGGQNLNFALTINEIKPYISTTTKMRFDDFVESVSEADYYIMVGNEYYFQGDYTQAITYYQEALQINPNSALAYRNLGAAYGLLSQYQAAVKYYQEALNIEPNYAEAHYGIGYYYLGLGQYQEAIKHNQKLLQLSPDNIDAFLNIGLAYEKLGQYQQAIKYYQQTLNLDPNFGKGYYNLGFAYKSLGQYQKARENWLKAKELLQSQGDYEGIELVEKELNLLP